MKKTVYVAFPKDGTPRIYINQKPPAGQPFLTNPDLKNVTGLPPHMWQMDYFKKVKPKFQFKKAHAPLVVAALSIAANLAIAIHYLW